MTHSDSSHLKEKFSKIVATRKVEPEIIGLVAEDLVRATETDEKTLEYSPECNCCKQLSSSESRNFELKFLDKISTPVFTGQKIKGEGCASIRVALYDCSTGAVVKSGPEANAKIEVVVLKGDSDGDGGDNLTVEDFERKIVKEIKGRKSVLKGKTMLKLKEGCCGIGEISFIHRSRWVKVSQLSLAARVVDHFPGTTIQPAVTESFLLKDCRNTLYKKKYPPSLSDEIWRLKKIGKRGAFRDRLKGANIENVKDFLKLLVMEPERLKKILRPGARTWETITEHASTCLVDDSGKFCYYSNPEHKNGVVFNVVGELKGLLRESQYVPVDGLSDVEKADARKLVMCAFQHGEELTPYNDENSSMKIHPPSSGSHMLNTSNEPQVKLNTYDYARPGTSPHANIPSISCVDPSSSPDHDFDCDASKDFFNELLIDPGYPIYSPETAHHHIDEATLLQCFPHIISNHQSSTGIVLDPQDVSTIDVRKRWRSVLIILNAIATVKSLGAARRFHAQKKSKISYWNTSETRACKT